MARAAARDQGANPRRYALNLYFKAAKSITISARKNSSAPVSKPGVPWLHGHRIRRRRLGAVSSGARGVRSGTQAAGSGAESGGRYSCRGAPEQAGSAAPVGVGGEPTVVERSGIVRAAVRGQRTVAARR